MHIVHVTWTIVNNGHSFRIPQNHDELRRAILTTLGVQFVREIWFPRPRLLQGFLGAPSFSPCLSHPQCSVRREGAYLGLGDDAAQTSEGNLPDLAGFHEPGKLIENGLPKRGAKLRDESPCEVSFRVEQIVGEDQVLRGFSPTTTLHHGGCGY